VVYRRAANTPHLYPRTNASLPPPLIFNTQLRKPWPEVYNPTTPPRRQLQSRTLFDIKHIPHCNSDGKHGLVLENIIYLNPILGPEVLILLLIP